MLGELIKKYFEIDSQMKTLDQQKKPLNQNIKALMAPMADKEFEHDGLIAVYSVQDRTSINEEKLVQALKDAGRLDCIKTVEVPDVQKVEDLVYNGELPASVLEPCLIHKEVETLSVKVKKVRKVQ